MLNRTIAPAIKNATEFTFVLPKVQQWQLHNGVQVYALHAGEEEVVQVEWVFFAGKSQEKKDMVAAATNFLLRNGTTTRTAFDINEQVEYHGAYLNRSCFNETSNVTLHCLAKSLPVLLPVVQDVFRNSVFPQQELDIFAQNSKQQLSVNLRKCDFVANREMDVLLYGRNHPYGKYSSAEALDALTREDAVAFYEQYYKSGQCVMFVAGKLPQNMLELLNQYVGHLPWKPAELKPAPVFEPTTPLYEGGKRYEILQDPHGVQGAIRIGRNFPNRYHPDFLGVQVLNAVLGGFFGSRLMGNIREDKGYTYGIYSYLQNHVEQSAWIISTEAGRPVLDATIAECYHEMERLRNEPISEEELQLVRNYLLGSVLGDLDGPFQVINRWKGYLLHGVDDSWFYKAIDNIKTIQPERLQTLAEKYLDPKSFFELVVI